MRVQLNRFEDNVMVVLLANLEGWQSFDMPRELLPEDAWAGDAFDARFARDREETERMAVENKRLLDDLLEREDG
jgi:Protein of unknown function (DUF3006)